MNLTQEQKQEISILLQNYRDCGDNENTIKEIENTLSIELSLIEIDELLEILDMNSCMVCGAFVLNNDLKMDENEDMACWHCRGENSFQNTKKRL